MLSTTSISFLRSASSSAASSYKRSHTIVKGTRTSHISLRYPPLLFDLCSRVGGKASAEGIEQFTRAARRLCGGDAKWLLAVAKDAMARLEQEEEQINTFPPLSRLVLIDDIGIRKQEWKRLQSLSLLSVHPRFTSFTVEELQSIYNPKNMILGKGKEVEYARVIIECSPQVSSRVQQISQEEDENRFVPVLSCANTQD